MAITKYVADSYIQKELDSIKADATKIIVCSGANSPADYAAAVAAALATHTVATGDWTISNGDTNGRKVRCAEHAAVTVDATGDASCIAVCTDTVLLVVTSCTLQTLTIGNTVTIPVWDIEISDPA